MTDSHTGFAKGVRKRETLRTPFVIARKLGAAPQEGEGYGGDAHRLTRMTHSSW